MPQFSSVLCSGDLDPAVLSLGTGHEQLAAVISSLPQSVLSRSSLHLFASEEQSVGLMPCLLGGCANYPALKMFSVLMVDT